MTKKLNIQDDGVELISNPPQLHESVQETARLWQAFCELPSEVKQVFATTNRQNGVGYEVKNGSGKNGDSKENFDYSRKGREELRTVLSQVDSQVARDFIRSIESLSDLAQPMIEAFGVRIEKKYGVTGFGAIAKVSAPNAFFRFIHYPDRRYPGELTAEPHVDNSGFTFHLFETSPGCERLSFDTGEWISLPVAKGRAVVFPSMQTQLVSRGKVKGLCHRVVANPTSAKKGRYAVVCFVALANVPMYDRKTHGRLQEMAPGFNYKMPQEEFEKLFKH